MRAKQAWKKYLRIWLLQVKRAENFGGKFALIPQF